MAKIIDVKTAVAMIKEKDRIMFGGFLAVGVAQYMIDELVKVGTKNLHGISIASDFVESGIGKLMANSQLSSLQASHSGTNPITQKQYNSGELDIEFIPQGTLMERIRAAGAGLGGILTPVGLKTKVEEGKKIIAVQEKDYILEEPIHADFALISAYKADKAGNLCYRKTAKNSNPMMATAAKTVIVEVQEIVEIGGFDEEMITTPGLFVDYIVEKKG